MNRPSSGRIRRSAGLPDDGSIHIESLTNTHTTLVIAGPNSRDVLRQAAPRTDWSQEAFPWLSVRRILVRNAQAVALSVSFSGELAWELHIPNEQLRLGYSILWSVGEQFGMKPFSLRATESMRIEKGYRDRKADLITEFNPFESALDRFVNLDKDFVGKTALMTMVDRGPRRKIVSMEIMSDVAPAVFCDVCLYDPENDQVRGGLAFSNTKDIRSRPVSDGGKGRYGCSLTCRRPGRNIRLCV